MRLGSNKIEIVLNLAIIAVALVVVFVFVAAYLTKQRSPDRPSDARSLAGPAQKPDSPIEPKELVRLINVGEKIAIVDIRPRPDFKNGHLPNAKSIPFDELGIRAEDELSRDSLIVLYADCTDCGGRNLTLELQSKMSSLGFIRVTRLQGGLDGWRQAGLEVVKD
jgi:rhodanese-related sulfurtransferase